MKVSFVEPKAPFFNCYTRIIENLPMMGPILLGTIIRNDGHDVTIYNENMERLDYSEIRDSDVLCISMMTATALRGYEIAEAYRFVTHIYPTDWKLFDGQHVVHWPDNMSPLEMQKQTVKALKKFYSRANMAKMLVKGRYYDFFVRREGRRVIEKWEKQNRDFLARLKESLAHG